MMEATYVNNHVCSCGYGALLDSIPTGTKYTLDMDTRQNLDFRCGGCFRWTLNMACAFAYRDGEPRGFIPLACFKEFQQ